MISQWPETHGNNRTFENRWHLNGSSSRNDDSPVGTCCAAKSPLKELGQAAIVNSLRHSRLFRNLDWTRLAAIAAITTPKFLPKGKLLFLSGDSLHGFFIVRAGSVKLSRMSCEGKEQVLHVFRTGESFAEEALVSPVGYPADAYALEDSVVLLVQKAGFLDLLRRHPEISLCILSATAQHTNDLVNLVADLKLLDVQTRLAKWLVTDCQQHASDPNGRGYCCVELSMTKRVLAAELGTSSETLSRTLAKLSAQGLVCVDGHRIILLAPAKLERLAEGSAEPCTENGWRHPVVHNGSLAA